MTRNANHLRWLRRLALAGLIGGATAVFSWNANAVGSETHDSGYLCGWVEDAGGFESNTSPSVKETPPAGAKENVTPLADVTADSSRPAIPTTAIASESFAPRLSDTCNYDATQAVPVPENVSLSRSPETVEKSMAANASTPPSISSRTSPRFANTIATIAAATTAGNRVPFGHWVEPFAMIGPGVSDTPTQLGTFQSWFRDSQRLVKALERQIADLEVTQELAGIEPVSDVLPIETTRESSNVENFAPVEIVPFADFDGELKTVDVDSELIADPPLFELVETTSSQEDENDSVDSIASQLVGGSGIIASIEEAYSPYDLAESDRWDHQPEDPLTKQQIHTPSLVWLDGMFAPKRQPFCVKSWAMRQLENWSPLQENVDPVQLMVDETLAAEVATTHPTAPQHKTASAGIEPDAFDLGYAECLLDELIWKVDNAAQTWSGDDDKVLSETIGEQVALLVVEGNEVGSRVANRLITIWPRMNRAQPPIVGAGAKLIARAEAAERFDHVDPNPDSHGNQFAQAIASLMQWTDASDRLLDSVKTQLKDIVEIALNRGDSDDSTLR